MRERFRDIARRAEKARALHPHKLALVSVAHALFVFGVFLLLLAGNIRYFIQDGAHVQMAYFLWAVLAFVCAYLAYDRVKEVDFLDFVALMVYSRHTRSVPHGAIIDSSASLLLLGLVVMSVAPIIYLRYSAPFQGALTLVCGAVLVAVAGAGYVLSGKAYAR